MTDIHPPFPLSNAFIWNDLDSSFWILFGIVLVALIGLWYVLKTLTKYHEKRAQSMLVDESERHIWLHLLTHVSRLDTEEKDFFLKAQGHIRDAISMHIGEDVHGWVVDELFGLDLPDSLTQLAQIARDAHYQIESGADAKKIHRKLLAEVRALAESFFGTK